MALELLQARTSGQQAQTQTVLLTPDVRGTSAEAELYSPEGTLKATLTPTLDTVDTTVSALGSTADVLTLTSATGVVVGREYWLGSASGWQAKVRVISKDANVIRLEVPPPAAAAVGDTFQGLAWSAGILGSYLTTRARHYRIDWRVTSGSEVRAYRQALHVVAMQFRPPVTADDAKRIAHQSHSGWAKAEPYGTWLRIAEEASDEVRKLLQKDEDFPHWVGDQDAFRHAGEIACRLELARRGRIPAGFEGGAYIEDQSKALRTAVRDAVGGVWIDRDESNTVDAGEVRSVRNIAIERA